MKIRQIKDSDSLYFEQHARKEDKAECVSVSDVPLRDHIRISQEESIESFVYVDENDNPLALWGIMKRENIYSVWLLTTEGIEKHKLSFMKKAKSEVKRLYKKYGQLWLLTDTRYERAIKLNEWCGFKLYGEPVFINDVEFRIYRYIGE